MKVASLEDTAKAKAKTDGEETSKSLAGGNPWHGKDTAKRPYQNLKKRLGSLVSKKSETEPSQPLADHEENASKAEQVPSSYSTGSIRQTAAQEPQEIPESADPQNAKPISKMPHGIARATLMQQDPSGPSTHNGARCRCTRRERILQERPRPATTSPACPTTLGRAMRLTELRRSDLSEAVLADGLAVHRPLLSLSASSAGMAEGDAGMG